MMMPPNSINRKQQWAVNSAMGSTSSCSSLAPFPMTVLHFVVSQFLNRGVCQLPRPACYGVVRHFELAQHYAAPVLRYEVARELPSTLFPFLALNLLGTLPGYMPELVFCLVGLVG